MPSPIDTLLRVHDSPLPTQIFLEFFGSIAIAPIDCTACSSNTGRKRVPPSSDFQMPPLAAPTKRVILPEGSFTPSTAEIRPPIAAGLNGEGQKDAGNFFVVANIGLYFHLCALLDPLRRLTNFQKSIRIEINESYVTILPNHFELVRRRPVDVFSTKILQRAPLCLPIN